MQCFIWAFIGSALAAPVYLADGRPLTITAAEIQAISPNSATCAGAPAAGQCRTAAQAAGPITKSLSTYKITSPAEAAALVSLMAYESADFKYQNNVYPGRPGQGTRNMQMINYNLLYANSIPELSGKVTDLIGGAGAADPSVTQANDIRGLLTEVDDFDFGSAAWFLTSQCSTAIRDELQSGSLEGWEQYISECVGTEATADRQEYWSRAIAALG